MATNPGFQGVSNCYVFKSQLQEYAQKVGLSTPVYDTIKEGPSHEPCFRSTVILNDVRYDSLPGFFNRKAAEQSAAEVALAQLADSGAMDHKVSQPVHETGLCKNLLQEYAQKMNYAIPLYECNKEETRGRLSHFSCTVDIGGIKYIGAAAKTKKEAEIKAARTALLAIKSSPSVSTEMDTDNSVYTVIPCKKKASDLGTTSKEQVPPVLKPKKARFKKRASRKRPRNKFRSKDVTNTEVVTTNDQAGPKLSQTIASEFQAPNFEVTVNGGQGGPQLGQNFASEFQAPNSEVTVNSGQSEPKLGQTFASEFQAPNSDVTLNDQGGPNLGQTLASEFQAPNSDVTMNDQAGPNLGQTIASEFQAPNSEGTVNGQGGPKLGQTLASEFQAPNSDVTMNDQAGPKLGQTFASEFQAPNSEGAVNDQGGPKLGQTLASEFQAPNSDVTMNDQGGPNLGQTIASEFQAPNFEVEVIMNDQGEPKLGQTVATEFQAPNSEVTSNDQGGPKLGQNFAPILSADHTAHSMEEVNKIPGVDCSSTTCHGEAPSAIDGLNQLAPERDAPMLSADHINHLMEEVNKIPGVGHSSTTCQGEVSSAIDGLNHMAPESNLGSNQG